MSRDWQISVVGAVAGHLVLLFGLQITLSRPAKLARDTAMEISLVAAPAAPAAKPAPPVEIPKSIAPPEVIIKPPAPTPDPVPVAAPPPSATTVANIPTPPAPAITPVRGDNNSPQPDKDAITKKAEVGVRAEPNYRKNPEPPYPLPARRRHEQGLVLLIVQVTAQGRAAKVDLKHSSGFPLLDAAALNAVRDWEFQPARVGSLPVESKIEVPVRFKLTE